MRRNQHPPNPLHLLKQNPIINPIRRPHLPRRFHPLPSQQRAKSSRRKPRRRAAAPEQHRGLAAAWLGLRDVDAVDGLGGKDAELGELAAGLGVVDLEVGVFCCEEEGVVIWGGGGRVVVGGGVGGEGEGCDGAEAVGVLEAGNVGRALGGCGGLVVVLSKGSESVMIMSRLGLVSHLLSHFGLVHHISEKYQYPLRSKISP